MTKENQVQSSSCSKLILLILFGIIFITGIIVIYSYSVKLIQTPDEPEINAALPNTYTDRWEKIELSKKLVVGISANNPPFEYYDFEFTIDGFDPVLAQEIGKKLELKVEFVDYAYGGLLEAVNLGQVDMAISAIPIQPEGLDLVDFTDGYYESVGGVLAREGTNIPRIANIDQLVSYRVGVKEKSYYQTWMEKQFIQSGVMEAGKLLVYSEFDQAIADLEANRIDLMLLDEEPANRFASSGNVIVIGKGLNYQQFGIAVQKGSPILLERLNQAITELFYEGQISRLAVIYLQNNTVKPQPITTLPPGISSNRNQNNNFNPGCIDGMALDHELNLADQQMKNISIIAAGKPFTKGWRIKNIGSCKWNKAYYLDFDGGNIPAASMGGELVYLEKDVFPGDSIDVFTQVIAPLESGDYQGFWILHNANGKSIGQRLWIGIQVLKNIIPTPGIQSTPSPEVQFVADKYFIHPGEEVNVSWNVPNASQVFVYIQGQNYLDFEVLHQGFKIFYPKQTTIYEFQAVFSDGKIEISQIQISVEDLPEKSPKISRLTLDPDNTISSGQCTQVRWSATGEVESVQIMRNQAELWNQAPLIGSYFDCFIQPEDVIYKIVANGPKSSSTIQEDIKVIPATKKKKETISSSPLIDYFSVNPSKIYPGQCVNITWEAGGGVDMVQLIREGQIILDHAPFVGTASDCLATAGNTEYILIAKNYQNFQVIAESTIELLPVPQPETLAGTVWRLKYIFDNVGANVAVIPDTSIILRFLDDKNIDGNGGCNNYASTYMIDQPEISFNSKFTLTGKKCRQDILDQEIMYWFLLKRVKYYEVLVNQLIFFDDQHQELLFFDRED